MSRGLVVFDLDGTLLRGQTVCEILADACGRTAEMALFEQLTTEEDITRARHEMAGWYRESGVDVLVEVDRARLAPGCREALSLLRDHGCEVGVASITWRFAVERIAVGLGIERVLATGLSGAGEIEHVWPRHKAEWLRGLAAEIEIPPDRTAAIGDSRGDLPMLREAGLAFFVGDDLPVGEDFRHRPDGDLLGIAEEIVAFWAR